jgi:hypothetical protein
MTLILPTHMNPTFSVTTMSTFREATMVTFINDCRGLRYLQKSWSSDSKSSIVLTSSNVLLTFLHLLAWHMSGNRVDIVVLRSFSIFNGASRACSPTGITCSLLMCRMLCPSLFRIPANHSFALCWIASTRLCSSIAWSCLLSPHQRRKLARKQFKEQSAANTIQFATNIATQWPTLVEKRGRMYRVCVVRTPRCPVFIR